MKNVFVFEGDNNNKFNRELKIKKHLNVEFIANEIDRFYPNIQELRKLKKKKPIIKDMSEMILQQLLIKQKHKRLIKSSSDPMILNLIQKNKNKFTDYYNKHKNNTNIFQTSKNNEKRNFKIKYRNKKLIKSKSFNLTKSYLKTNESINKYIPKRKFFPKIPKYFNSMNKFKRNKFNNEYLTIRSNLSSIDISTKEKKVPKIYEKVRNLSNISKKFYIDIKNDINRFQIDNFQNPYYKSIVKEERIKIKRIKELENFIEYKKPFFK